MFKPCRQILEKVCLKNKSRQTLKLTFYIINIFYEWLASPDIVGHYILRVDNKQMTFASLIAMPQKCHQFFYQRKTYPGAFSKITLMRAGLKEAVKDFFLVMLMLL